MVFIQLLENEILNTDPSPTFSSFFENAVTDEHIILKLSLKTIVRVLLQLLIQSYQLNFSFVVTS